MTSGATSAPVQDERRAKRVPYDGRLTYRYSPVDEGKAVGADVSPQGLRIRLGRYLRPGRRVVLRVDTLSDAELKGRVTWCRPANEPNTFDAGIRVFHDAADSAAALSEMIQAGRKQTVDPVDRMTGRSPSAGDFRGDANGPRWYAVHRPLARCAVGAAGT